MSRVYCNTMSTFLPIQFESVADLIKTKNLDTRKVETIFCNQTISKQ